MRNLHIKPKDVVPVELRIQIYKEAIEHIKSHKGEYCPLGKGLCLLMPCLLWGLENFMDDVPGISWAHYHTLLMFPEFTDGRVKSIDSVRPTGDNLQGLKDTQRIVVLEEMIEEATLIPQP